MDYIKSLQKAIKRLHGCESKHIQSVPIKEVFHGKTVWNGEVEVFDLIDHPKAKRCYAWSHKQEKKGDRFIAVLELPPIDSPKKAVQVAIVQESKK